VAAVPTSDVADVIEKPILTALMTFVKSARAKKPNTSAAAFAQVFTNFADDHTEEVDTLWRWRDDIDGGERQARVAEAFASLPYADRLKHVRRPEECDEAELLAPIWAQLNEHLGTNAQSLPDLVEQLGIARFGHRPKVADTFCGGGSIPFEAARIGCDVYASDLNPIACMLTWGAFNIIGATEMRQKEIETAQEEVTAIVDAEITQLGIENDSARNRAKNYLYVLETRCPKTGWMVPMAPSWEITKDWNVVAVLIPDHEKKRYAIAIKTGVSAEEMFVAKTGTIQNGRLVHPMLDDIRSAAELTTIRGDYRDSDGVNRNRLRLWEKSDFIPRPDDIFQERLYCIQWITKESLGTEDDLAREQKVEEIVRKNLARWQEEGLVPDLKIMPGEETTCLFRERGWTYWHHLFTPRQLLFFKILRQAQSQHDPRIGFVDLCRLLDRSSRLPKWSKSNGSGGQPSNVFDNQALNTQTNFGTYASTNLLNLFVRVRSRSPVRQAIVQCSDARKHGIESDIFLSLGCAIIHRRHSINGPGTRGAISPSKAKANIFVDTWWQPMPP
jgi:putative DNA methylase